MFNGNFKAECAVRPPSNNVAAIPEEASANAIFRSDRIVAKNNEMRNVFPVPPGESKKYNPPVLLWKNLCSSLTISLLVFEAIAEKEP